MISQSRISDHSSIRQASTSNHFTCAMSFSKMSFDSICHDQLWVAIMDMGYTLHLIALLAKLHKKQFAEVKVAGKHPNGFMLKKSPTMMCPLSAIVQPLSGDGDEGDPR